MKLSVSSPLWILSAISVLCSVGARNWRRNGTGTIALEEAWTVPELVDLITATPPLGNIHTFYYLTTTQNSQSSRPKLYRLQSQLP
ncbi:hypothetical protein BDZ94DRAFT_626567 [Collybia nuda]|uniref:Uncharacterized protein n=1 Tax=Collybia nuda TaxID=64659 RepID=A0A9P5Y732_9AGAR|nr:hypothetical protein BDZ94DRAFT_626567 [Collybia nuda]